MALDIGIGDGSSFCPVQGEPLLALDDDGYYWFLHLFFEELAAATGQYIDLHGDASFSAADLSMLEGMLNGARQLIKSQPAHWEVCIGSVLVRHQKETRSRPYLKKTFATVEKSSFLLLLSQWEQLVARAKELERPVVCFGD